MEKAWFSAVYPAQLDGTFPQTDQLDWTTDELLWSVLHMCELLKTLQSILLWLGNLYASTLSIYAISLLEYISWVVEVSSASYQKGLKVWTRVLPDLEFWVFRFCHNLSIELCYNYSFLIIWVFEFFSISVFELYHNLRFLRCITIWVFELFHYFSS